MNNEIKNVPARCRLFYAATLNCELTFVKSKKLENSKDLFKSCDKGSESTLNQS